MRRSGRAGPMRPYSILLFPNALPWSQKIRKRVAWRALSLPAWCLPKLNWSRSRFRQHTSGEGWRDACLRLWQASLGECRVREVLLEVRESNQSALAFYGSLGFVEEGRRHGYYDEPVEDAILMRLKLCKPPEQGQIGV